MTATELREAIERLGHISDAPSLLATMDYLELKQHCGDLRAILALLPAQGAAQSLAGWEPANATPGEEVKLWAVLAYPGSRVSDLWIGGHRVQVPNDALKTSWAFANLHSPRSLDLALAEYDRAMREEVVPAIMEDERRQALTATRLRLGLPPEPPPQSEGGPDR